MGTSIPVADLSALLVRIPDQPMGAAGLGPELGRGTTERDFHIAGDAGGNVERTLSLTCSDEVVVIGS